MCRAARRCPAHRGVRNADFKGCRQSSINWWRSPTGKNYECSLVGFVFSGPHHDRFIAPTLSLRYPASPCCQNIQCHLQFESIFPLFYAFDGEDQRFRLTLPDTTYFKNCAILNRQRISQPCTLANSRRCEGTDTSSVPHVPFGGADTATLHHPLKRNGRDA